MKSVAYLTMEDEGDFVTDYDLSFDAMAARGWRVETVPWRSAVDWEAFDAVYICAPWDYPEHLGQFLEVLGAIDASSALLVNDLSLVLWTLEKTYLRDIEQRGGKIVPSAWFDGYAPADLEGFFETHTTGTVVIKPTVGANAKDAFVLVNPVPRDLQDTLETTYLDRKFLVQPFIENIRKEGEYSLFFFNGEYSHAILKTPETGDFRVQEEHGADIRSVRPPGELLDTATAMFNAITPLPVYGRGDWVRDAGGDYLLMELELIEPSLYLRTDSGAASRFAAAFDKRFEEFARK